MEGVETAGAAAAGAAATAAAQSAVVPSPMGSITIPTEDAAAPRLDVSDKLVDKKVVDHKVAKARGAGERVKHGKTRSLECGGNALCVHGRRKYGCKECGGSQFCPHGKIKRRCRECGGSDFCPHDRRKGQCKECGGSQICVHNRQKFRCKDCHMCQHYRVKARCPQCIGDGAVDAPPAAPGPVPGMPNPSSMPKPGRGWRAGPFHGASDEAPSGVANEGFAAPLVATGSKRSREGWEMGEDGKPEDGKLKEARGRKGDGDAHDQLDASLATDAWNMGPAGVGAGGEAERQVSVERASRAGADVHKELETLRQQHALALAEIDRLQGLLRQNGISVAPPPLPPASPVFTASQSPLLTAAVPNINGLAASAPPPPPPPAQ